MDESTRFLSAVSVPRPRGARIIEAFSPKLGRRLQCFGRHAFDQWICLESDPAVLTFCERPLEVERGADKCMIDLWARHRDQETLLLLGDGQPFAEAIVDNISIPIRRIPLAELSAAHIWISNWERMLPYIVSCRQFITTSLLLAISELVSEPMQLSRIERDAGLSDPTLVRAAVFRLLHRGQLRAPILAVESLSQLTQFEPPGARE